MKTITISYPLPFVGQLEVEKHGRFKKIQIIVKGEAETISKTQLYEFLQAIEDMRRDFK